jgi:two-component system, sensor histidine kinase and response regulator
MDQPNHILIIDDVPENIQILSTILQRRGYAVSSASGGKEGLELARTASPHLILLDIAMPEMDGFEVCRILKAEPATREIPVIFLTAFYNKTRVVQGFDLGGMDYIARPFNTSELFARIRTHLELKHTKDLLQHRNQELHEMNTTLNVLHADKDELLGIVVHDLKNPLAAIRGIVRELLADPAAHESLRESHEVILQTADRMFELIKDLLSMNAIQRGGMTMRLDPVELADSIHANILRHSSAARAKQITLSLVLEDGAIALADETAFGQILDNLISNAIKYSPKNTTITLRVQSGEPTGQMPHGTVRVEVQDEGPGLTTDDMGKLFGKFTRLSAQPTADEHSTGLGLSIVKKLADAMNVRVWCESLYGQGATFIVELPKPDPIPDFIHESSPISTNPVYHSKSL